MSALAGVLSFGAPAPAAERALDIMLAALRRPPGHELRSACSGPARLGAWQAPGGEGALVRRAGLLCALDGYVGPSAEAGGLQAGSGPAPVMDAYRLRGARLGDRLAGNFAAAVWDEREARLLLVRDQGATRGLFFTNRLAGMLLFASEPRALLAALQRRPDVDRLHLAAHLAGISLEDAQRTAWEGLQRVPAEHALEARADGATRLIRYSAILDQPKTRRDDWPEVLRTRLGEAAGRAVMGEQRAAIALSGGLDSNSVAAVLNAARGAGRELSLHGLTFEFPSWPSADERPIVAQAVKALGIEHEYIDASGCWPLYDYPHTGQADDLPPPSFPSRGWPALFDRARAAGAPVVLTGHGSDHLFVPSPLRFVELMGGSWRSYAAERRGFRELHGAGPGVPLGLAARTAVLRHAPHLARMAPRLPLPPTLPRAFAREVGLFGELIRVGARTGAVTGRMRAARLTNAHAAQRLNEHFDALAREHHCELRYPFLDRDVMAAAMRIPVGDIHQGGWMKVVLRRMLRGVAPDAVVDKPTPTGHAELFRHSLGGAGVPALEALLSDSRAAQLGALDTGAWWRGRDAWLSGQGRLPPLLSALTAEVWLRRAAGEPLPETAS